MRSASEKLLAPTGMIINSADLWVLGAVDIGKVSQWEPVCKNHRFPHSMLHYVLKFCVQLV